jgi:hypothetical protein
MLPLAPLRHRKFRVNGFQKLFRAFPARISEGHQLGLTIAYKTEIRDSLCLCVENYGRQAKLHDNRTQLFDRILQANWRQ